MGTAVPFMLANILSFLGMCFWGWTADIIGRRWAMIIPAAIAIFVAPIYLFTVDPFWITVGFGLQGAFGGALYSQLPAYLSERFPTEVRATASAFCYHQGAILGGLVAPVLAFFAVNFNLGYAIPMLVGTVVAAISVVISLLLSPETRGKILIAELQVA
jgi:SHS family lactate transporter-like MFS transporter